MTTENHRWAQREKKEELQVLALLLFSKNLCALSVVLRGHLW